MDTILNNFIKFACWRAKAILAYLLMKCAMSADVSYTVV